MSWALPAGTGTTIRIGPEICDQAPEVAMERTMAPAAKILRCGIFISSPMGVGDARPLPKEDPPKHAGCGPAIPQGCAEAIGADKRNFRQPAYIDCGG